MSEQNLPWFDIAKGIGIILVVLAHSIFPFVQQIDYFHMALFFILAGVTYRQKSIKVFLLSKINRIFIPWVFWSILSGILSGLVQTYGGAFNGPLWFLQNIFVALVMMHLISSVGDKWQIMIFVMSVLVSVCLSANPDFRKLLPFNISLAILSVQFIWIGKKISQTIKSIANSKTRILSVGMLSAISFLSICMYLMHRGVRGSYVSMELFEDDFIGAYLAALSGSLCVIVVSQLIRRNTWLEWLGRNSLVVMCVHFPFCMYLDGYLVTLPCWTTPLNKLCIAAGEWSVVITISCILCMVCHRYIPRLTGYKNMIAATPFS